MNIKNLRKQNILKVICFLCILTVGLHYLNYLIMVKDTYANSTWPSTSNYETFYRMDEDSIDVLFLGSSVEVSALNVQQLYNDYGITSYSLGTGWQSPMINYYWLKEAFKTQSPKVVVLDTFSFFRYFETSYNMTEPAMRKPVDAMRWSLNKLEMVRDICSREREESIGSYLFTNIRYHNRWKSLDWTDLDAFRNTDAPLKGYSTYVYYSNAGNVSLPVTELDATMMEYVDKMQKICQENGTELILITLPGTIGSTGTELVSSYASEKGLAYYNLNTDEAIAAIGAEAPRESIFDHENLWGSKKTTTYLYENILANYQIAAHTDQQYEDTRNYYDRWCKSYELYHITDYTAYLEQLDDPAYTIYEYVNTDGNTDHAVEVNHETYGMQSIGHNYVIFDNVLNKVVDVSVVDEGSNTVLSHEDIYADSIEE